MTTEPRRAARPRRMRILAGGLAAALALGGSAKAAIRMSGDERLLIGRINQVRQSVGLRPLRASSALLDAALQHDREMVRFGYFGHSSRDGAPFWRRIGQWYPARRSPWAVAENLLAASPQIEPARVVEAWLGSPEHRAILLGPAWREVGIAVVHVDSAPGIYHDQPTTLVTADFGVRH